MLGEVAAEVTGAHILGEIAQQAGTLPRSDTGAWERLVIKAFKRAHEAAQQLYKSPPEQYVYPKGSR